MIYHQEPENFKSKFDIVSCFVEHGGEILLLHRQDHKPQGNTWGVPAGKVDGGETLSQAIARELAEEIGLVISPEDLPYETKVFVRYPDYDFIYHMFRLPLENRPDIKLEINEHKDFTWKTPAEALEMPLILDEDPCIRLVYKLS